MILGIFLTSCSNIGKREEITLKEKGVPSLRGGSTGDQVTTVEIVIPKSINEAQRKALLAVRDTGKFRPQALDDVFATLDADEMALELHAGPVLTQSIEDPGAHVDEEPDDRLAPLE